MRSLELVLFETDAVRAKVAHAQGISSFMFDVESRGKKQRQNTFDTDISVTSLDELPAFVAQTAIHPICRLDPWHSEIVFDIDQAIIGGASELLFPMIRTAGEVERLLSLVDGRLPSGIMIETKEILDCIVDISQMPLRRVYVGLNDLMISIGGRNLFEPMIDGTVDRIRSQIGSLRFGVAGATRVDAGSPIPFQLLLADLARLEVDFTMLRRSFWRDVKLDNIEPAIRDITELWKNLLARTPSEVFRDRSAFTAAVSAQKN